MWQLRQQIQCKASHVSDGHEHFSLDLSSSHTSLLAVLPLLLAALCLQILAANVEARGTGLSWIKCNCGSFTVRVWISGGTCLIVDCARAAFSVDTELD